MVYAVYEVTETGVIDETIVAFFTTKSEAIAEAKRCYNRLCKEDQRITSFEIRWTNEKAINEIADKDELMELFDCCGNYDCVVIGA